MVRHNDEAIAVDLKVGRKIQNLRITKGLSRKQLSAVIGVTHQQLQKYEKAINRISAGRLFMLAEALDKPVAYFFDDTITEVTDNHQRLTMEAARGFMKIENPEHQTAVHHLIKTLAS